MSVEPYYIKAIKLIKSLLTELADSSNNEITTEEDLYKPILDEYYAAITSEFINKTNSETLSGNDIISGNLEKFNDNNLSYISALYARYRGSLSDVCLDFFDVKNIVNLSAEYSIEIIQNEASNQRITEEVTKKSIIKFCLKKGSNEYISSKIKILVRIFNALAISVLKAEYIIFDDFSREFDKLVGFSSQKSEIETLFINSGEDVSSYIDTELLKSLMSSVWYVIELCKKNKFHDNHGDESLDELIVLNNNRKERSDTVFGYDNQFDFISKHVLSSFQSAFESLVDITTIDYHYNYSVVNFNNLCLSIERIDTFKKTLLKELGSFNPNDNIRDRIEGDDGLYFDNILDIIKFKAKVLLSQYINNNYKETDTEFFKKHKFIIYGFDDDFMDELKKYDSKIELNKYAKLQKSIINGEKSNEYGEDTYGFLNNDNKHEDVKNYNKVSEKSIKLFNELAGINNLCDKAVKNNKCDINRFEDGNRVIIEKIKSVQNKIIKNPRFFVCIMDYLKKVINNSIYTDIDTSKKFKFTEKQKELLNRCYEIFVSLNKDFDIYLSRSFDYSTLRYQKPFQYSFYKYNVIGPNEVKVEEFEINEKFITNYKDCCTSKETVFFFASAGLAPLNVDYLRTKHFEFSNDIADLKFRINTIQIVEATAYFEKSFNETEKKIDVRTAYFEKSFNETEKKIDVRIENTNNKTITLLGILGSFLAFTTLTIGTIRAIDNITKFILFTTTYLIAVISFVFCIKLLVVKEKDDCESEKNNDSTDKDKTNDEKDKESKGKIKKCKSFKTNLGVIIIMAAFVIIDVLLCLTKKDQIFDSPKVEETTKPSVTNNSMQLNFSSEHENPVIVKDIKYDSLNKH